MIPVSSINAGAIQSLTEPEKSLSAQKVQESQEETKSRPIRAGKDEYIPEEKSEPFGRYWMGKDEDGQPKVFFDDPEKAAGVPGRLKESPDTEEADQDKKADDSEKADEKGERCICSTDQVDREIEKLKEKKGDLEKKLNTETDEKKVDDLQRQLEQVARELLEKDNDSYRKQHATFTRL